MKSVLPLIAVVLLASSCSTAYKSGQTPDDVYFSPEPKPVAARSQSNGNDYVQMDRENSRQYRSNRRQQQQYSDPYGYYDDRYLRMKVRNRRMWSDLDYYYSDPYAYRYYDPFWGGSVGLWGTYNYWNPYMAWGYNYNPYYYNPYYYSPYGGKVIVGRPVSPVYSRPRTSNMNVFSRPNSPVYRGSQFPSGSGYGNNNRTYSQPRDFGNDIRRSFGNNSNNNNSISSPSRSTINNGSSSGSSGGSSGGSRGGSAPVRRF